MFDPVDPRQKLPALEEGILRYWKEEDTFKRSLKQRSTGTGDLLDGLMGRTQETYSFYDGPPFATGLPHYGHLLAGTIKDVIPRYQTMRGKYVERRFGWDCHGLPVENIVEQEKGIKSRKEIEEMGVAAFNGLCRTAVQRYTKEWRKVVERMGRWVDMDWDYRTMDPEYMESIWWVFSELQKKGLIYEGYKGMYICPRCATPLANFEVAQGYRDRTDLSVIVTFPLKDDPNTMLLAWTTTPWSLPGNLWLTVGPHIEYAKVESEGKHYVLAKKLVEKVFNGREFRIVGNVKPSSLVGKKYEPLFPYFVDTVLPSTEKEGKPETYGERANKVVMNDVVEVSDEEGTGIVHITSSTGEDSYAVAKSEGVDVLFHVELDGFFSPGVTDFAGLHVKPEGKDPMATDKRIIEYLKKSGRFFSEAPFTHSYPHCWRCDTPLIPYTTGSWFVAVEKIKDNVLAANAETEWVPAHIRDGRFGKWLEGARDWAISRNRYWGTPLPIWRCAETDDMTVIASRDELMAQKKIRFTRVTALRHGESSGNLIPVYQGKEPGSDLTDKGKEQAKAAADYLNTGEVSVIYCSPLERTRQTAAIIAKKTGAPVVVDPRLCEVCFGNYEGKTVDFSDLTFIKARRAHKMETGTPESIYHFPGMEKWSDVEQRIRSFMEEILPLHRGGHVVLVTHADPIQNLRHFFGGEDPVKLSHQPYPLYATPYTFFWDHEARGELDLHKHIVDGITWNASPSKEKKVHLTFVRHGETDWNKERKLQGGNADIPLNATGRKQALEVAKLLKRKKFDVIVSSDLSRAVETAKILSSELNIPHLGSWEILRERDQGDWSGRSSDELRAQFSIAPGTSISFHPGSPPHGESRLEFLARVDRSLQELLRAFPGKCILLTGHGGVLRAMQSIINHIPPEEARPLSKNAGITEMIFQSSPDVQLTLVRHGQTDYNKQDLVNGGNIDTVLNETGRKQVQALAKKLKKRKFDLIISSDLKRAVETADILSKELNVPHVARWKELRERDTGDWTGQREKVGDTVLPNGTVANAALFPGTPPKGESLEAFLRRLETAVDRARAAFPGKRVLVVSHAGPMQVIRTIVENLTFAEAAALEPDNAAAVDLTLTALMRRVPEVLDCWFESGSMPYAQSHFPFNFQTRSPKSQVPSPKSLPPGFPADFIAEGIDQTRGWFYTLMILSSALFKKPAFRNCIVNGIVLTEDGKKMSKRLKNYPEPTEVVHRHGADAVRFTLMASPAVRGEDLKFSEKLVEETVRSVLLPLWNVYSFFVTYANAAKFEPTGSRRHSAHPLDRYVRAELQDLVNRMTKQLDGYDLSAGCAEIHETIEALTNWYVRLSRRRFAGKGAVDEEDTSPAAELSEHDEEQLAALETLYDVLLTLCQTLAPFCPFLTEAVYLNLVPEDHTSIHLSDWPEPRDLTGEEKELMERNRLMRHIVSLGHAIRSGKKIKVRQPLARTMVALSPSLSAVRLTEEDRDLLKNELNVKDLEFIDDPGKLACRVAQVDARKVGPRLGARVQEIIRAGKSGEFTVQEDGSVLILDEVLAPDEVAIVYRGMEGQDAAVAGGIVVCMDTAITDALKREGHARDLIRAVQKLRKEAGLHFTDRIALAIEGMEEVVKEHGEAIAQETNAHLEANEGTAQSVEVDGMKVTIRLEKRNG